jgi:hypothetical protein
VSSGRRGQKVEFYVKGVIPFVVEESLYYCDATFAA